jgi:hypothetical protein
MVTVREAFYTREWVASLPGYPSAKEAPAKNFFSFAPSFVAKL